MDFRNRFKKLRRKIIAEEHNRKEKIEEIKKNITKENIDTNLNTIEEIMKLVDIFTITYQKEIDEILDNVTNKNINMTNTHAILDKLINKIKSLN